MYIQISIPVKEPFLEEIQQSSLSINQMNKLNIFLYNSYFKQGRYFNETNKKSDNLVSSLWMRYLIKKTLIFPLSVCIHRAGKIRCTFVLWACHAPKVALRRMK